MTTVITPSHVDLQESHKIAHPHSTDITSTSSDANAPPCHSPSTSLIADSEVNTTSSLSTSEIVGVSDKKRESSASGCSVELVDLEAGVHENKLHLSKIERDCRICHMSLDVSNQDSGVPIELGCSCKHDLASAHKHCAETWFKIKGNKTCEICGSVARNVSCANETELLEQWNEANDAATAAVPQHSAETLNFWQGHRFLNFLLACMVFAFVISWLFHFNVPS